VSARCYLLPQVLDKLQMPRATFFTLKRAGKLPCAQEIEPRLGRCARYRADLIDRWVAGQWGQPRSFASHRRVS
jgi:hypothetical protein